MTTPPKTASPHGAGSLRRSTLTSAMAAATPTWPQRVSVAYRPTLYRAMIATKPSCEESLPSVTAQATSATPSTARGARLRQYSAALATAKTSRAAIGTSPMGRMTIESPGPSTRNTAARKTTVARTASAARGQRAKGPRNPLGAFPSGGREGGAVRSTITPR